MNSTKYRCKCQPLQYSKRAKTFTIKANNRTLLVITLWHISNIRAMNSHICLFFILLSYSWSKRHFVDFRSNVIYTQIHFRHLIVSSAVTVAFFMFSTLVNILIYQGRSEVQLQNNVILFWSHTEYSSEHHRNCSKLWEWIRNGINNIWKQWNVEKLLRSTWYIHTNKTTHS